MGLRPADHHTGKDARDSGCHQAAALASAGEKGPRKPRKRARPKTHADTRKASAPKAKASKTNGAVSNGRKQRARRREGGPPARHGVRRRLPFPALAESRRRLFRASEGRASSPGELTEAVESDVALTIAVMRALAISRTRRVEPAESGRRSKGLGHRECGRWSLRLIHTTRSIRPAPRRSGTSGSGVMRWPPAMRRSDRRARAAWRA